MKTFFELLIRFFKNIFSRETNHQQPQTTVETTNKYAEGISYSAELIPSLLNDHQQLVEMYGRIGTLIPQGNFTEIQSLLGVLKNEFNRHIMQENVSFYCYIEQQFAQDENHLETIKEYRKEMNGISHAFIKFIKKWQAENISLDNLTEFQTEYNAIGDVLAQRINREENELYTLYQPSF